MQMREALATGGKSDDQDAEKRRRAIKLFQLGIASGAEVRLLADYISKLDFIVNQTMHVFISCEPNGWVHSPLLSFIHVLYFRLLQSSGKASVSLPPMYRKNASKAAKTNMYINIYFFT